MRGERLQPTPRIFAAYARSGPVPKKDSKEQQAYELILKLSDQQPRANISKIYTRNHFPKILEHCYYAIREHPFHKIYPYLKFSEALSIATCTSSYRRSEYFQEFKELVRNVQREMPYDEQIFAFIRFATVDDAPLPYHATNGFSLLNLAGELSQANLIEHRRAVHLASRPEQKAAAQRQCEELENTLDLVSRLNEYPKGHLRDRLRQAPEPLVNEFMRSLLRNPAHYIWNHDKGFESGTPLHFTPRRNAKSAKKVRAFAQELARVWNHFPRQAHCVPASEEYLKRLESEQRGDPRQLDIYWRPPF